MQPAKRCPLEKTEEAVKKNDVLVGNDGRLIFVELGTELVGDGIKTITELMVTGSGKADWFISAMAATGSVFPSGFEVEDLFPALGTEVLAVGDKIKPITEVPFMELSGGWDAKFTKDWIEVTLQHQKTKKYRGGKQDATGSIKGAFVAGVTSGAGGMLNKYMKLVTVAANGTITISPVASSQIYIKGVVNNGVAAGDLYEFMWAKIETGAFDLTANDGSRQEYTAEFRFVGNDPVFYSKTLPAA